MADVRPAAIPADFAAAVRSFGVAELRPEVRTEPLRAPQRLAPWAHALGIDVITDADVVATGRLVLLHDPAGYDAWQGTFRLVGYATVDLEPDLAADPLLAEVGWSWLIDALAGADAGYTAIGGTITRTTSTRFGELPPDSGGGNELEVRASWTPLSLDLGNHLRAWGELLCAAAGLPPPGIAAL